MFLEKEGKVYEEYIAYSTKIWKFALRHKFALQRMVNSNGYNSGTFKDRSKLFAPKLGFSGPGRAI